MGIWRGLTYQIHQRLGDSLSLFDDLLRAYSRLEREDVLACLAYARHVVGHERVYPPITDEAA